MRALFEERPCSGGARVVHRVVDGHAIAEKNIFGVLSADFENRIDAWIIVRRSGGVSGDFVVDVIGAEISAYKFASRSGRGYQTNRTISNLVDQCVQTLAGRSHRIRGRAPIMRRHNASRRRVECDCFRGGRACVDAKDQRTFRHG